MKLNQVNALVAGRKSEHQKSVTNLYHMADKRDLFDGFSRSYQPLDEVNGDKLPGEQKRVQQVARLMLKEFAAKTVELLDLVATQDRGNQLAVADIVVDDVPLLTGVPVTTLLFLEKQVNDWITFVSRIHVPDPGEQWDYDASSDLFKTSPARTLRTKKVPKAFVKYEATDKHPAQVDTFTEDVTVGTWTQIQYTGRLPAKVKNEILIRLNKLKDAVKVAREQANSMDVKMQKLGESLFDFAFGTEIVG